MQLLFDQLSCYNTYVEIQMDKEIISNDWLILRTIGCLAGEGKIPAKSSQ